MRPSQWPITGTTKVIFTLWLCLCLCSAICFCLWSFKCPFISIVKQSRKHQFPNLTRVCCRDRSRTKLIFSWFECLKNAIFVSECSEDMCLVKNGSSVYLDDDGVKKMITSTIRMESRLFLLSLTVSDRTQLWTWLHFHLNYKPVKLRNSSDSCCVVKLKNKKWYFLLYQA